MSGPEAVRTLDAVDRLADLRREAEVLCRSPLPQFSVDVFSVSLGWGSSGDFEIHLHLTIKPRVGFLGILGLTSIENMDFEGDVLTWGIPSASRIRYNGLGDFLR